jgi:small nuclear ribonucleoprotein G
VFILTHCSLHSIQDKRLQFSLNGNRKVIGTLRGYDAFLNVVLEEAEDAAGGNQIGTIVIRGNSIIQFEGLERVST